MAPFCPATNCLIGAFNFGSQIFYPLTTLYAWSLCQLKMLKNKHQQITGDQIC
jgi:hypothetical protein